jgi:transposase-like protein
VASIAPKLGANHETLRQWVKASDEQAAQEASGFGLAELEGLKRLRKENAELKFEKEIEELGQFACLMSAAVMSPSITVYVP